MNSENRHILCRFFDSPRGLDTACPIGYNTHTDTNARSRRVMLRPAHQLLLMAGIFLRKRGRGCTGRIKNRRPEEGRRKTGKMNEFSLYELLYHEAANLQALNAARED